MGSIYADFLHLPHRSIYSCAEVAQEESDSMKINLPAIYNILIGLGIAACGGILEYLKVEGAATVWTPIALIVFQSIYQALKVRKAAIEPSAAVSRGEVAQPTKWHKFFLG